MMRAESPIQVRPAPSVPTPETVDILGVPLALTDYDEMLGWMSAMITSRSRGYLCACNVHTVMASREDEELRESLLASSLNVPDGQPLVWAINSLGHSLTSRVYGPELMSRACSQAAEEGHRFYLYGGRNQGPLVPPARNLPPPSPGGKTRGWHSPPHREPTEEGRAGGSDEIQPS